MKQPTPSSKPRNNSDRSRIQKEIGKEKQTTHSVKWNKPLGANTYHGIIPLIVLLCNTKTVYIETSVAIWNYNTNKNILLKILVNVLCNRDFVNTFEIFLKYFEVLKDSVYDDFYTNLFENEFRNTRDGKG